MYSLVVIAVLSIVEANQEFTCKPQPGCHFARCSPLWPVTVPALRERNEFPINCVKNGTDPKDEDQDKVLKSHKQMISELTNVLTEAKGTIKELEKHSDETSKVMASQTQTISNLKDDMVKANGKIAELEKNSVTTNQTKTFQDLTAELDRAKEKITQLENRTHSCSFTYHGKCFWFGMDYKVTHYRALEICAARGGTPANIYSEFHYYMMLGYLRMFAEAYEWTDAWLGVKYNSNTNVVSLSDGSAATFVKWHKGYPVLYQTSCVYLAATLDPSNEYQNLVNAGREWTVDGVICEI